MLLPIVYKADICNDYLNLLLSPRVIPRFDFADFNENSDLKEEAIILLGEVIKFHQLPTHIF